MTPAQELLDWFSGPSPITDMDRVSVDTILRALRLLAAAEANGGSTPETDACADWNARCERVGDNEIITHGLMLALAHGEGDELRLLARRLERERNALAARVRQLEKDAERIRHGLALFLDLKVINSENIGDIRRSLFLPLDCAWNCWVRELTAERENSPPRHPLDVQAAIDAARSKP